MLTVPSGQAAAPQEDERPVATVELTLGGMHCNACATRIERALANQRAVLSASVNLATNRAFVTYDATEATTADLCATVGTAGYSASPADGDHMPRPGGDTEHWGLRAAVSWPAGLAGPGRGGLRPRGRALGVDRARPWPSSSSWPEGGPSCAPAPGSCVTAPPAWTR